VIKILSLDLRSEKDLVLEDYEFSIDAPGDTIIVQDEIAPLITHNMTSRYRPIRPIDAPITQLLSPEIIPEPEETTNSILLLAVDSIILIHKSKNNYRRTEEYPKTPIVGGTTEPPAKKIRTPNLLKGLETDLNPESIDPNSNK
jgi:hypothetical protein